ncbi:hypothetical protein ACOMHN_014849 [Nucella lapillus]
MLEIMDTNTGDKQKQDVKKTEKTQNKANSVDSHDPSRPRDKKKQTTLERFMFRHYEDSQQYSAHYRHHHTVANTGRASVQLPPEEAVLELGYYR